MRNFFRNTFTRNSNLKTKQQISEILDTDEDKVINQYKGYLKYINAVKKDLLNRSEDFMGYNRQLNTQS